MRGNNSPEIFDIIAAKFVANLPKEELTQQRLGFHFERAYFYYLDTQGLQSLYMKVDKSKQIFEFCKELLRVVNCPQLPKLNAGHIVQFIEDSYCNIPVNGIILLNMQETHALLVESHGNGKYGFPKGKIHEGETPQHCAMREVKEEIGLSVEVDANYYVQVKIPAQTGGKFTSKMCRFYICKIQQSCIVPRKCKSEASKQLGIRQIIHSASQIKSIGWYKLVDQIPKMMDQNKLNSASRQAYYELIKKTTKNLNYKQKKRMNPLQQFKGFDKAYSSIFLK